MPNVGLSDSCMLPVRFETGLHFEAVSNGLAL